MSSYEEFELLIQAEEFEAAEKLLFDWIRDHPNDARAWLLYGKCVSSPSQKRDCFKRALSLDPLNEEAKELLKQVDISAGPVPQGFERTSVSTAPSLSELPAKVGHRVSAAIPKAPRIGEGTRTKLSFILYSILHLLITVLLGGALVFLFYSFVPGLLDFVKADSTFQRNWASSSSPTSLSPELERAVGLFLNPSRLDYRQVDHYEDLRRLRTNLTVDSAEPQRVEFSGVSFVGQLVGGRVLQSRQDGQPAVLLMEVLFDEKQIPVVYYGPVSNFHYEDRLLIEGVYVAEANTIAAQRVEQISTSARTQPAEDTLTLLRASAAVFLWALFCASVFIWKLNFRRWFQANAGRFLTPVVLLLLIASSTFLSGCSINLSTTLREDGTGTTMIVARESQENMDFLRSAPGISGYMSAVIRDLKASGAMFDQFVEGDQEVFVLQRSFNNSGGSTGETYPIEGSWVYVQRYKDGNEEVIRFVGLVDTRTLYVTSDQVGADVANALRSQLNEISITYQLNVPGQLVYHNGDQATDHQVSWQLRMNEANYLVAETRLPVEGRMVATLNPLYVWIALGVVFLFSTLLLIMGLFLRKGSSHDRSRT